MNFLSFNKGMDIFKFAIVFVVFNFLLSSIAIVETCKTSNGYQPKRTYRREDIEREIKEIKENDDVQKEESTPEEIPQTKYAEEEKKVYDENNQEEKMPETYTYITMTSCTQNDMGKVAIRKPIHREDNGYTEEYKYEMEKLMEAQKESYMGRSTKWQ